MGMLGSYRGHEFCEMSDGDGGPRAHYQRLYQRLDEFDADDLESRANLIGSLFRRQGITFAVYGSDEGLERPGPSTSCHASSR